MEGHNVRKWFSSVQWITDLHDLLTFKKFMKETIPHLRQNTSRSKSKHPKAKTERKAIPQYASTCLCVHTALSKIGLVGCYASLFPTDFTGDSP